MKRVKKTSWMELVGKTGKRVEGEKVGKV